MNDPRPRRAVPLLAALLAALCAAALPAAGSSQTRLPPPPPKTDAGSWQGSWYYTDRVANVAIWLDEGRKGRLSMRYRYRVKAGGDGDSGETGTGPTSSPLGPGTLTLTHRLEPDGVIRGRLTKSWGAAGVEGTESHDFEAWRIHSGDHLYFILRNGKRELREGGETTVTTLDDIFFKFVKATDEIIFWGEFPF